MAATAASLPASAAPEAPAALFVSDLPRDMQVEVAEKLLRDEFGKFGDITTVKVCLDMKRAHPAQGTKAPAPRMLGTAYVNFKKRADAQKALEGLNFKELPGQGNSMIRVAWSERDPVQRKTSAGNLFVSGLADGVTTKKLYDAFRIYGDILSCKVVVEDPRPPRQRAEAAGAEKDKKEELRSRHYGFVHFEDEAVAAKVKAEAEVGNIVVEDQPVKVEDFKQRAARNEERDKDFKEVFIKNIAASVTEEQVRNEVQKLLGGVTLDKDPYLKSGSAEGAPKHCFVTLPDHANAEKLVELLNDKHNDVLAPTTGKKLEVSRSRTRGELAADRAQSKVDSVLQNKGLNVFVRHIPVAMTDEQLKGMFSQAGEVEAVSIARTRDGTSRQFAFVTYKERASAKKAIEQLNGRAYEGSTLYVTSATNRDSQPPPHGGRGGAFSHGTFGGRGGAGPRGYPAPGPYQGGRGAGPSGVVGARPARDGHSGRGGGAHVDTFGQRPQQLPQHQQYGGPYTQPPGTAPQMAMGGHAPRGAPHGSPRAHGFAGAPPAPGQLQGRGVAAPMPHARPMPPHGAQQVLPHQGMPPLQPGMLPQPHPMALGHAPPHLLHQHVMMQHQQHHHHQSQVPQGVAPRQLPFMPALPMGYPQPQPSQAYGTTYYGQQ